MFLDETKKKINYNLTKFFDSSQNLYLINDDNINIFLRQQK